MQDHNQGVTLTEVIVAITIAILVIVGFVPAIWRLGSAQLGQLAYAKRQNEISRAITTIQQDIMRTNQILRSPLIFLHDTNSPAPSSGWHFAGTGNTSRNLILSMTASTLPVQSKNRKPVFVARSNADCAAHIKEPLAYNSVYFIENSNLYRRTLIETPPDMILCDQPHQKPSNTDGSLNHQKDMLILKNVTNLSVDYYLNGKSTPEADAYNSASTSNQNRQTPLPYRQITITIGLQPSEEFKLQNNNIIINESLL